MSKVSIIIPSRNEKYLLKTIDDIYEKATGEFEVIVGFNGKPFTKLPDKPNLFVVGFEENIGLKPMINELATRVTGKYIYKSDAHCMFGKGFDEILQADMEHNWVVTPRFYVLDAEKWQVQDGRFYDYFYLSCPFTDKKGLRFKAGGHWPERTKERDPSQKWEAEGKILDLKNPKWIDETPQMHGSGWFIETDYFFNGLHGFPQIDPMGHAQEPIWLGLSNWLRGGKLMVNKKTWYAHLHQDSKDRGYPEDKKATEATYNMTAQFFLRNIDRENMHTFDWFVKKFMPMPTWPDNWEILLHEYLKTFIK